MRHFLACVQKDAKGFETTVNVDIASEKFTAKGLIILEKNYLEVYIYEKWNAKELNNYRLGDTFMPTVLDIVSVNVFIYERNFPNSFTNFIKFILSLLKYIV